MSTIKLDENQVHNIWAAVELLHHQAIRFMRNTMRLHQLLLMLEEVDPKILGGFVHFLEEDYEFTYEGPIRPEKEQIYNETAGALGRTVESLREEGAEMDRLFIEWIKMGPDREVPINNRGGVMMEMSYDWIERALHKPETITDEWRDEWLARMGKKD